MLKIDSDFPGANIQVYKNNDCSVEIDTDLRDTDSYWFYWCFRATADKAGKYNFKFKNSPAMTGAGPVVSYNQGASWEYLGKEKVDFEKESFEFVFEDAGQSVMFSFAIPYLEVLQNMIFYQNIHICKSISLKRLTKCR